MILENFTNSGKFGTTAEEPFGASFLAKELVPMNYKS